MSPLAYTPEFGRGQSAKQTERCTYRGQGTWGHGDIGTTSVASSRPQFPVPSPQVPRSARLSAERVNLLQPFNVSLPSHPFQECL